MGSPCIGNSVRYEKVTTDISMQGEFHPAISPGGLIAGWYRGQHHRPEYGEASVVGYYSHHTRSTFVPPGAVESGAPITAFVIGPSQLVPSKNTLQGNLCMSMLSMSML